jgi:hypothetical protein
MPTPCYNTTTANRHLDSKASADFEFAALHAELANDMQRAMAGLQNAVPGVCGGSRDGLPREVLHSPADEIVQAVDRSECIEALMLVLKDSDCPMVARLRGALVTGYVANAVDGIAEARGMYL